MHARPMPAHRLARSALALSTLALATALIGCKTPIPETFDPFVPAEFRDKVSMAVETGGGDYGADKMLLLTYDAGPSDAEIDAAYMKHLEAAGFTTLTECKIEGEIISRDFIKSPAEHVQVFFRLPGSAEAGPMLHVFHTAKLRELGGAENCSFTEAAKTLCKTLEADRCVLGE